MHFKSRSLVSSLLMFGAVGAFGMPAIAGTDVASRAAQHHDIDIDGEPLTSQTSDWYPAYPVTPQSALSEAVVGDPSTRGAASLTLDFIPVGIPPEGDTPSDISLSADGSIIVIAHRDSQNLVVFDADTRVVLQTIPLSGSPNSLALSSDGVHAVTANIFEDTASIVDLVAGSELAVVAVGDQPGVVHITPDGTTAVVGNTLDSDLSVIDIASGTQVRRIPGANFGLTTSFGVWAVVYTFSAYEIAPDNNTVVFPDLFNAQIQFFDIAAGTVMSVACDANPAVVDLSPDGTIGVVSHHYPDSKVSVVDVEGRTILKVIPTGGSATMVPPIAINPEKTKAVVAVQNAVRVVDLGSDTTSGDLSTGSVNALITTADGQYCVVGNYMGSLVSYVTESIVGSFMSSTTPDRLAVSPANPRAATAHALRKEFMEVMNVNGAAGYLEDVVPTGPPPEGDKARNVAVPPDGTRAVVLNNHSHNAIIMDLPSLTIEAAVDVGERPGGVAITPDGTKAVVANLDSTFASVIDLDAASATNIAISRRGSQVAISPSGQYAYIPVVADGDGVWRINLNTLAVDGPRIYTGNMGGIGFIFDQASGMTLSHDGPTLVTCGSFDNNISIIDTATWSEVARVPVGTFPVRAAFGADDSMIYVTNKNSNTVSVVTNAGAGSSVVDTISVGDQPFELVTNPAGTKLYVANFNDRSISVIDLPANTVANTIPIPQTGGAGQPVGLHVSADGGHLYVAANGADFHVIDTTTDTIIDTINTGVAPAELVFSDATVCGHMPSPYGDDGLSIVCIESSAAPRRPNPWEFEEYGGSCDQDSDCWGPSETAAYCVPADDGTFPGVCYAPANRYISIARHPEQVENTARRITLQGGGGGPWWVGSPTYNAVEDMYFASVSPTSVYAGIGVGEWVEDNWPDVIHVKGCEIAPNGTYLVQAIQHGQDEADEGSYSEALELRTAPKWGDVVSTCVFDHCLPPTGSFTEPSIDDVLAVVNAFTGIRNAPLPWLDVDPVYADGEPEGLWALIGDVLAIVNAFSGQAYPGNGPLGCP
jgi:YVTN family beta-propeller protein